MEQEQERGITITSAATTCFWKEHQINIIDTPGHVDFTIARICFVNKMDKMGGDFDMTIDSIKKRLAGNKVVAIQYPIGAADDFTGLIDIIEMKAYHFEGDSGEKVEEIEIPADLKDKVEAMRLELIEKVAEQDDALMDIYFAEGDLSVTDIKKGLRMWVCNNNLYAVACGSALQNIGVQMVIDAAVDYLPGPLDVNEGMITVTDIDDSEKTEDIAVDVASPLWALAFKVATDPFVGRLTCQKERVGRLVQMHSNSREEVPEITAGNIGAVIGLKATKTGDTLCDVSKKFLVESMEFPEPVISISVEPKTKADQEKMGIALGKLAEEDPSFRVRTDEETAQTIISGMGELHLDIIVDRMKREFKVECNVGAPQVAYRETIKTLATDVEHKFSKQTGGRGQFGHVVITFEPYKVPDEEDEGVKEVNKFVNKITGGVIPKEYIPGVQKGLKEAYARGFVAGYPMVDVKATLTFGSFHDVDSSELAFKIAASKAFRTACTKAQAVILEPIMKVEVNTPEEYMGDVIGQINSKRGRIEEMSDRGQAKIIACYVPLSEMFGYSTELRSASQGRATYGMEFDHYEEVPTNVATKIREERGFSLPDDE